MTEYNGPPPKVDTSNDHLITRQGRDVLVQVPISGLLRPEEALRAAAWLLVAADIEGARAVSGYDFIYHYSDFANLVAAIIWP